MGIATGINLKSQRRWGGTSNRGVCFVALVCLPLIGSLVLVAEPIQSESSSTSDSTAGLPGRLLQHPPVRVTPSITTSVSAFSATQSAAGRVLMAAGFGERDTRTSNASPARAIFPILPAPAPQLQAAAANAQTSSATESAIATAVGRSLRAYTRDAENAQARNAMNSRRRATFSSAISRAAAAGALAVPDFRGPVGSSLNPSRFAPPPADNSFDPGFSQAADVISVIPGLSLQSVTLSAGYSSNALPRDFGGQSNIGNYNLGPDYDLGASAVLQYGHSGRHSSIRINYMPSHIQRSRIPEWSSTDHRLSLGTSYDLTPRWTLSADGRAANVGQEQSWYVPPALRDVSGISPDLDGLLDRLQAGEISDDEFAAVLTGSPVVDNPGGREQDLSRVLSAAASASASYAYSRRVTMRFGGSSTLNRMVDGDSGANRPGYRYIQSAQRSNADMSVSYRLSSRTQITALHQSSLSNSTIARSLIHNPSVSLRQRLSRHWNYQVGIGVGAIRYLEGTQIRSAGERATLMTANGRLNYMKEGHVISAYGARRAGDEYGLGSRSTLGAGVNWSWQSRRGPWGGSAGIGITRSDYINGVASGSQLASDLYSAGVSRRLTPSMSWHSDYYYGAYESPYVGVVTNMSVHRVQMSLVWRPAEKR